MRLPETLNGRTHLPPDSIDLIDILFCFFATSHHLPHQIAFTLSFYAGVAIRRTSVLQ